MATSNKELPGFDLTATDDDHGDKSSFSVHKKKSKSGGFQTMGLSHNVLKGILKRGYKQPTPIQRKTIPVVVQGRDVVAMARTGSGKTACFLIPLLEKLKTRVAKHGARAIIFSPTRELALQTLKFLRELGRYIGLKTAVILGGDSMDEQFSALHGSPDVIVATPGRFLHVCVEMDLKLTCIEYVVFDEADRLFEMGLGDQLTDIILRLPSNRQTVLFSATLPKLLVEFTKAGLVNPVLIRLDVEAKIPPELELFHFHTRPHEKLPALIFLLRTNIDKEQQTVVFVATKHHVEYLHAVLNLIGISNTYIYSNLDPSARKINEAKFRMGKCKVLIVTDIAARGIDIPFLDNVINYNFPAKSKLFVHRVGRCARAGRSGTAYSLISPDEYVYLLDLQQFLDRPLIIATPEYESEDKCDCVIGCVPSYALEEHQSELLKLHDEHTDLSSLKKNSENAYQQYVRTRPCASTDSNKRVKELGLSKICNVHPIWKSFQTKDELSKEDLLLKMKNYRPNGTIFEICGKNKSEEYIAMKIKRGLHRNKIEKFRETCAQREESQAELARKRKFSSLESCTTEDIDATFETLTHPKKTKMEIIPKRKDNKYKKEFKDVNHYVPYAPVDQHTERGLAVRNFETEAKHAELDLIGTGSMGAQQKTNTKRWDRKRKRMVAVENFKTGKIKTESGVWLPASYKSNRYAEWKEKTKIDHQEAHSDDDISGNQTNIPQRRKIHTHWAKHNEKVKTKKQRSEMKSVEQILKNRRIKEKQKLKQKRNVMKRYKRKHKK